MRDVSSLAETRTVEEMRGYSQNCVSMVLTILSNVSGFLIDILELAQGLDDVDVLSCPGDDEFRALV